MPPDLSIIGVVAIISAPIATVATAFFAFLSTRSKNTAERIDKSEKEIEKLRAEAKEKDAAHKKQLEEINKKLDDAQLKEDAMLRYIFAMRRRDYEEGRDPLPLPVELQPTDMGS